jgi:hypothetical protein
MVPVRTYLEGCRKEGSHEEEPASLVVVSGVEDNV